MKKFKYLIVSIVALAAASCNYNTPVGVKNHGIKNAVFQADSTGRKIRFAQGNLYKDYYGIHFEEQQYAPTLGYSYYNSYFSVPECDSINIDGWRLPTKEEMQYIFQHYRYAKTLVCAQEGVLLLPDNITDEIMSEYFLNEWEQLQNKGAVFFPSNAYGLSDKVMWSKNIEQAIFLYEEEYSKESGIVGSIVFSFAYYVPLRLVQDVK